MTYMSQCIGTYSLTKRNWIVLLSLIATVALTQNSLSEEKPKTAFFHWAPVSSAVFAIYTKSEVGDQQESKYLLYHMEYEKTGHRITIDDVFDESIIYDGYRTKQMDLQYSDTFLLSNKGSNQGGELALWGEMYRHGHPLAYWTDMWWKRHWIVFPVFQNKGQTIALGDTWVSETWPFIQDASLGYDKIMRGTVKVKDLPPTSIKSHWRAWEKKNGFPCAVIDFSFQAKSDPKLVEGKEASEYNLSGTSYFSVELGLPVATEIKASGFVVNGAGERKKITLLRREVLVTHEAKKEEDRDIKK